MTEYTPLKTNPTPSPVFCIATDAPLRDLFDSACHRIQTSADLLDTLATLKLKDVDDIDLTRFASAAYLLCQDGVDVLQVVRRQLASSEFQHPAYKGCTG